MWYIFQYNEFCLDFKQPSWFNDIVLINYLSRPLSFANVTLQCYTAKLVYWKMTMANSTYKLPLAIKFNLSFENLNRQRSSLTFENRKEHWINACTTKKLTTDGFVWRTASCQTNISHCTCGSCEDHRGLGGGPTVTWRCSELWAWSWSAFTNWRSQFLGILGIFGILGILGIAIFVWRS